MSGFLFYIYAMKNTILILSIISTGLMAGLFYAWSVSVMTGLKRLPDHEFIAAMRAMNRAIQNPIFFLCFFGSAFLLIADCVIVYDKGASPFYLILAAAALYIFGVFGITVAGNVPLNNMLDDFQLDGATQDGMKQLRGNFENRWNFLNNIRTVLNIVSFALLVTGILMRAGKVKF